MDTSAILLIVFNRPETTRKVWAVLQAVKPSRLYIAADAPRMHVPGEAEKCAAVKAIVHEVDWEGQVSYLFQEQNLGCSLGPREAFQWFFQREKEGIILEDDCVPHPDFFPFATILLQRFRDNKRILSINGSNLGYTCANKESYTFCRFMNMWGWATWADRAAEIDYSLADWKKQRYPLWILYKRMRQSLFDADINWYKYWKEKFDLTITREKITWWDWQWIYHQLRFKKLSVVPCKNLVTNIGFHAEATHTIHPDNPSANIKTEAMDFPLIHPVRIEADLVYEENVVKWVWCYYKRLSLLFYIKFFLSGIIKNDRPDVA